MKKGDEIANAELLLKMHKFSFRLHVRSSLNNIYVSLSQQVIIGNRKNLSLNNIYLYK